MLTPLLELDELDVLEELLEEELLEEELLDDELLEEELLELAVVVALPTRRHTPHWPEVSGRSPRVHHLAL